MIYREWLTVEISVTTTDEVSAELIGRVKAVNTKDPLGMAKGAEPIVSALLPAHGRITMLLVRPIDDMLVPLDLLLSIFS